MSDIKEGQKVRLTFKTEDGLEKELQCFIKELYSDRIILEISDDLINDAELLEEGSDISVRIYTPSGIKAFESLALEFSDDSSLVIDYSEGNAVDIQRRKHCRLKFKTKICIEKQNRKNIVVYTIEVSEGSVMFYSEESFAPYETVNLSIFLPEVKTIKVTGFILDDTHLPENHYVICFTLIDEKDCDTLHQAALARQF